MKKVLFALLLFVPLSLFASEETLLLRFPAVHGEKVVFSHAGDLYLGNRAGGVARKLTNHPGYEVFPKFSHDGNWIAFTGQYDGNTEVYVIPAEGGVPKRITYTATLGRDDISDRMGPNNIVMDWTPDDKYVLFRSRQYSFNSFKGQLFLAPVSGDLHQELPFSVGGWATFGEDQNQLAMNRVFREFRTWKYYRGGMADEIWLYDLNKKTHQQLTNNEAQDIFPMWYDGKVFFLSDRDRTMNLFVWEDGKISKLTQFTDYDIKFPSLCTDAIAFEQGGRVKIWNIKEGKLEEPKFKLEDDMAAGRDRQIDASEFIRSGSLSPDGKRIALSGRGDIWTVPASAGVTRNLTRSSGIHERNVAWSPDGKWLDYLSDESGEFEIWVVPQDGSESPRQVTKGGGPYKYQPKWSPDSKFLLLSDRNQDLYTVELESGNKHLVYHSEGWEIRSYNWSPDGKWIIYLSSEWKGNDRVQLFSIESGKTIQVTHGWFQAGSPTFSPDGKYLWITSARDFHPIYNSLEWNHAYSDMNKVFMVLLDPETESPFALENDEVEIEEDKQADENESEEKNKEKKREESDQVKVKVVEEGLDARLLELPVDAGSYWNLQAVEGGVYYMYRSRKNPVPELKFFDLKKKEEKSLGPVQGFALSADGKKMMIRKGSDYFVEAAGTDKPALKKPVPMDGMKVWVNLPEEWKQIYSEAWRQMRDYFYDPAMHGVDWPAIHDKYAALLPHVHHRNDLNYLIGEMIGELNVGHAYINGGDRPEVERIKMGLLGARYTRHSSGYYQIRMILEGESWDEGLRSPLQEPGIEAREGDYIIAVNGRSTKDLTNLLQAFIGTAGQTVELTLNDSPSEKGARKVLVKPIADESALYYHNWVRENREKVTKLSGGKIGYIHIPDMVSNGLNQFARQFYPQLDKQALIIDDRGNGGGNVSPMIIERLRREIGMGHTARNVNQSGFKPNGLHLGPKVCLIDPYSASDGDLFPYQFRHYGIGKLIGQRSWGGVIGIRGSLPFVDGADLRKPEFGHYAADGKSWIIEGRGVSPDIEVVNDPLDVYAGKDAQLEAAVSQLLDQLKNGVMLPPKPPKHPNKSK